ncbi:sarcosine oxidase subunit delta [Agrobacterium vitis]|nr:sarcosine oxidase subunit delta [Agrobacterium vitis]MBE1436970.1 sarcosine oxidase subunit delta [Agrobacterium vitis]
MASLITCPHCGVRPREEFTIRGDASPVRPKASASDDAWYAYVYSRENIKGRIVEHWQHTAGCRRWLVVERDNAMSHAVYSVKDVATVTAEVEQ